MTDFKTYVEQLGQAARNASRQLATLDGATKVAALKRIAQAIRQNKANLLAANAQDVAEAQQAGLAAALIERLKLNDKRIEAMAVGVEQIAAQVDPVGQTLEGYVRPNGLRIEKRRVPLGVILFFYESRPNVTSDAAALCIKSGNAIILRGGKEALQSNRAIVKVIHEALEGSGLGEGSGFRVQGSGNMDEGGRMKDESRGKNEQSETSSFILHPSSLLPTEPRTLNPEPLANPEPFISPAVVQLVETTDRALVPHLLKLDKYIDLVIPRGGESLIRAVVAESTIPVLKHFTGNCHLYIDASARDMEAQVRKVCVNAKTSYPGGAVCNAVEHLIFHRDVAKELLPKVCADLAAQGVEIRADERAGALYPQAKRATPEDWGTEYLSYIVGVKVVDTIDEAIDHINEYGSRHTDAILASDIRAVNYFIQRVDTASVMVNASTRFADGGEYGLGAEIGISTDKMHARGPMGASDLTTYKWIVTGDGHCR